MYKVDSGLRDYDEFHLSGDPQFGSFEDVAVTLYRRLHESNALQGRQPLRVLDLGCGKGVFLKELKERLEARGIPVEVHGVGLSRIEPEYARTHGVRVHIKNVESLPVGWTDRFHLVISVGVFKHLDGGIQALREAHRVLHPEGRAYLHLGHEQYHDVDWQRMAAEHPEKTIEHEPCNVEFGKKYTPLRLFRATPH
ncbi:class I SAM-dependent methyltransferase [Candidatus Micrarchaeota archaeon]|nr:class I SAM-dependent methyltransferase [Candidatus Micrarchaeota archaeon]